MKKLLLLTLLSFGSFAADKIDLSKDRFYLCKSTVATQIAGGKASIREERHNVTVTVKTGSISATLDDKGLKFIGGRMGVKESGIVAFSPFESLFIFPDTKSGGIIFSLSTLNYKGVDLTLDTLSQRAMQGTCVHF